MITITSRIFFQIILVIIFSCPKLLIRSILNSCRNLSISPMSLSQLSIQLRSSCVEIGDHSVREFLLFGRVKKHSGAVLSALVVSLLIQSGWIVNAEKEGQKLGVGDFRRIVLEGDGFGVASRAGTYLAIGWIRDRSADVTDLDIADFGSKLFLEPMLATPEATECEGTTLRHSWIVWISRLNLFT